MSTNRVFYWRSKDGGPWEQIEVGARSILGWHLGQLAPGEVYDDDYGNRYRLEREDQS